MNFNDVPHIAHYLMEKHGLIQKGWVFKWDNAKRRAGACWWQRKHITLSHHYVRLNLTNQLDDIIDTILHEIAHAIAGQHAGHGKEWKLVCEQIGARPERCYSISISMPPGKLSAICQGCGKVYRRHKSLRVGIYAYCRKCGPENGRLVFRTISPNIQDNPPTPRKLE